MNRITIFLAATLAMTACRRHTNASMTGGGSSAVLTGMAMAPPAADHCPTAPLIMAPVTINGDLTAATSDSNERIDMTGYTWLGRDHFFAIDLQAGQPLRLSLVEQGWDGGIYVFRNCAAINATTVAGRDTSPTSPLAFTAPMAGRYYIAVDAWQPNTGRAYTLSVTPGIAPTAMPTMPTMPTVPVVPPVPTMPTPTALPAMPMAPTGMVPMIPALPLSDHCMTAQPVPVPSTINGDLTTMTADSNDRIEVTGYAWQGRDQFFALVLSPGQHVRFTLNDNGNFDGGLYIFRDCANIPGTVLGGADTNPNTPLEFVAPAAGRYILAVDAWQPNTGGAYTLTIAP